MDRWPKTAPPYRNDRSASVQYHKSMTASGIFHIFNRTKMKRFPSSLVPTSSVGQRLLSPPTGFRVVGQQPKICLFGPRVGFQTSAAARQQVSAIRLVATANHVTRLICAIIQAHGDTRRLQNQTMVAVKKFPLRAINSFGRQQTKSANDVESCAVSTTTKRIHFLRKCQPSLA